MRAATITQPGGPEAIEIVDVTTPEPGPGDVLVRVVAAGVNPVDAMTRRGEFHAAGLITLPRIGLGWDLAGEVLAVGPNVHGLAPGARVAGFIPGVDLAVGSYADAVVVPEGIAAEVPSGLDLREAAGIPLAAVTARQAVDLLDPDGAGRVLITGAAGMVGGYALDLAAARGFAVTGLARDSDADFVRAGGATPISALPPESSFDAIIDAAALGDPALGALHDGGTLIDLVGAVTREPDRDVRVHHLQVAPDPSQLAEALEAAARGELRVRTAAALPLTEAVQAHRLMESGGQRGRIVLLP